MKPRSREPPESPPDPAAHLDPGRWEEFIREARPDAILVVVRNAMSKKLRWKSPTAFRAWLFEIALNRADRSRLGRVDAAAARG